MSTKSYKKDLLSGSLTKNIIIYTLPIMATGILQLLFNTADLIVVGHFNGSDALAAVGSTSALINLIVNLLLGLSVGSAVSVAHAFGARDKKALSESVHTAMAMSLVGGIIVGIVGVIFGGNFLELMKTDENVIEAATLYIRIYFIGIPASMVYNFGASILRAVGNTKTPLIFLSISGVVNVALNIVLVWAFSLGVAGVAIATAVSQLISAILVVAYMMRTPEAYRLSLKKLGFRKKQFMKMLAIGLPAGLQGSLFSISNVIIQSSVNSFGNIVVAGNTAAMTIEGFVYTIMNAFGNAAMTFVGQSMGAEKHELVPKITKRAFICVTVIGLVAGCATYIFRQPLLSVFLSSEDVNASAAAVYGSQRLLMICVPYFVCGIMDVMTGSLRGMGSSTVPMIITIIGVCGLRVVWIYTIFAARHELSVLYLSYPVSWLITAAAQFILYMIIKSRRLSLLDKKTPVC